MVTSITAIRTTGAVMASMGKAAEARAATATPENKEAKKMPTEHRASTVEWLTLSVSSSADPT